MTYRVVGEAVYFCLKWICGSTKHATLDVMCYVYDRGEEVGMYYCACYGTILVISSFVCRFIPPSFHRPPPYFALTTKHYWSNLKLSWLDRLVGQSVLHTNFCESRVFKVCKISANVFHYNKVEHDSGT